MFLLRILFLNILTQILIFFCTIESIINENFFSKMTLNLKMEVLVTVIPQTLEL